MPADQQACFKRGRANPVEACGVVVSLFRTEEWLERRIVHDNAHHRPVAGCLTVEMFARHNAASAGHVARYNVGVARNMFGDVAADGARQSIIAAAIAGADDHEDIFIRVKFSDISFG